jgi:hypothetical protein
MQSSDACRWVHQLICGQIVIILQAHVSVKRIEDFLNEDEGKSHHITLRSDGGWTLDAGHG